MIDINNYSEEEADEFMRTAPLVSFLYAAWATKREQWFAPDPVVGERLEDIYQDESYVTAGFDVNRRRQDGVVEFQVKILRTDSTPNS